MLESLKNAQVERLRQVRHQMAYEFELLQKEKDFPNAHQRLRMIALIDEELNKRSTESLNTSPPSHCAS